MLHGRKIRQVVQVLPNKLENSGCEESSDIGGVEGKVKLGEDVDDDNDDDAEDAESGNESEGTQPEEVRIHFMCICSAVVTKGEIWCSLNDKGRYIWK